jgi:hypothetical protein
MKPADAACFADGEPADFAPRLDMDYLQGEVAVSAVSNLHGYREAQQDL